MKVILLQDVPNLGDTGAVVNVKNGYGRNYLIPQGLAVLATAGEIKRIEEEHRQAANKLAAKRDELTALAEQLGKVEVVVQARVGEEDRIFGTVTPTQVAVQLDQQGFSVDKRRIKLAEEIKTTGVFTANVQLASDIIAAVKVRVDPLVTEDALDD